MTAADSHRPPDADRWADVGQPAGDEASVPDFAGHDGAGDGGAGENGAGENGADHDGADHEGADHEGAADDSPAYGGADREGADHEGADHEGADHEGAADDSPAYGGADREGADHEGAADDSPAYGGADREGAANDTADQQGAAQAGTPQNTPRPTLLDQMGGPVGMLDSGLPVVVFVIVNVIAGLTAGIIAALAAGVLIAVLRLVRRKPVAQAIGGLFAVGVAAYIAHRVGSARGYFLFGIWTYLLYGGALLASILVRWPLVGVLWEGLNGRGRAWRRDRHLLRRYDAATLVWVAVFAARYVVQRWLYGADQVGWLAFARLAMGYPLFILAIIATVLVVGSARGMHLPAALRRVLRRPTPQAESADPDRLP